jgi:hypothetical protein
MQSTGRGKQQPPPWKGYYKLGRRPAADDRAFGIAHRARARCPSVTRAFCHGGGGGAQLCPLKKRMLIWKRLLAIFVAAVSTECLAATPATPVLQDLGAIVKDPAACVRDPTQVLFVGDRWHFWATRNPACTDRHSFPRATVDHYFSTSADITGPWNTSGVAVGFGSVGTWDAWSVFTPGAIYDPNAASGKGLWYLWYGAVANGGRPTRESIGLATASSPFGPWTRSPHNPVFLGNATEWCGAGASARVDEAEAYVVNERKFVLVKGVCQNFTALPSVWESVAGPDTFDPPYATVVGAAPIVSAAATPVHKGFEQARIFPGPDGLLHLTGHNHGANTASHFVSFSGDIRAKGWHELAIMTKFGLPGLEPTPAYSGVPGDRGGVPTHFIQFDRDGENGKLEIHLLSVSWRR